MKGAGRAVRPAIGAVISAAAGVSLWAAGAGTLPLPSGWSGRAWTVWWEAVGPLVAVFSVGRVMLIGLAGLLAVGFTLVAAAISGAGAADLAERLLCTQRLPGLGPIVRLTLALSASGTAAAACGSTVNTASSPLPPAAPVLSNTGPYSNNGPYSNIGSNRSATSVPRTSASSRVTNPPVAPAGRAGPAAAVGPAATVGPAVARGPAAAAGAAGTGGAAAAGGTAAAAGPAGMGPGTTAVPPPGPSRASAAPPHVSQPQPGATWRVQPGESLWSIAEATAGVPADGVPAYWAEMVELNRPTLPVPGDPSLLFPGDLVRLPPR